MPEGLPPIQPPDQATTPKMASGLSRLLWPGIVVVVLIAVGGSAWLAYQKQNPASIDSNQTQSTQKTATTTDEMKDWKTYRNEEYGFEFQYPHTWTLADADLASNSGTSLSLTGPRVNIGKDVSGSYMSVMVVVLPVEIAQQVKENILENTNLELQGLPALLSVVIDEPTRYLNAIELLRGSNQFRIVRRWTVEIKHSSQNDIERIFEEELIKNLTVQNQVLSTFKFIPSTSSGQAEP